MLQRIISITLCSSLLFSLFGFSFDQEANVETIAKWEIVAPEKVRINEAFDVTVRALDAAGKKITQYEGTVALIASPEEAFDMADDEYTFTLSDQGEHVFSKAFTITKAGIYTLEFIGIDDAEIVATATIIAEAGTPPTGIKTDVTITEPVANTTVGASTVTVSGTSKPNSTIQVILNQKKAPTTQTDTTGKFSLPVEGLTIGENTISADVLDGTAAVIGSSTPLVIKYSNDIPKIESLSIKEGNEVFVGQTVTLLAKGDAGIKSVTVKIGDKNVVLEEDINTLGQYSGAFKVSAFEGESTASVALEDALGIKAEQKDMLKFTTLSSRFENVKVESLADKRVQFTFSLKPDLEQIHFFKIRYGNTTGVYTKEVITHQKTQIKKDASYAWYIPNLDSGEYFSTIIALDKDKKEIPINSGEQKFLIEFNAATTCYVDQVSGLQVTKKGSSSLLSWSDVSEAATYQIFKKDTSGEFALIDEVKTNSYKVAIDMSAKEDIYEDFQVRATCKSGDITGEGAYSESVAVQTGPAMTIFMLFMLASGIAYILLRRGYLG